MTNNQKKIVAIAIVAGVVLATKFYLDGSRNATLVRFPELDPQIARKAYKIVMRKAMTGDYGDISNASTEEMDRIFFQEVALLELNK